MHIPDKIKIGGMEYTVKRAENLLRDRNCTGESCGNKQSIQIDLTISPQLAETTFIHEVLHQLDYVYHIGLEHDQVYQLETAIYAFIKDNPEIFKEGA